MTECVKLLSADRKQEIWRERDNGSGGVKELFDCVGAGHFLELGKFSRKEGSGRKKSEAQWFVCVGVRVRAVLIPGRFEGVPPRLRVRSARGALEGSQSMRLIENR